MAYAYMPVCVKIKDRSCLVVGGGVVALRKVEALLDYECQITVVAPEVDRKLEYFAERGKIKLERRRYATPEATGYGLVISATDDRDLNQQVYDDCHQAGVLVNVADDPPHCDFIFPSVVRRHYLTAAVSTDGQAPFIAAHLRQALSAVFPERWTKLMKHAAAYRKMVRERWEGNAVKKEACFDRFLEADWKTILKERTPEEIQSDLQDMLDV